MGPWRVGGFVACILIGLLAGGLVGFQAGKLSVAVYKPVLLASLNVTTEPGIQLAWEGAASLSVESLRIDPSTREVVLRDTPDLDEWRVLIFFRHASGDAVEESILVLRARADATVGANETLRMVALDSLLKIDAVWPFGCSARAYSSDTITPTWVSTTEEEGPVTLVVEADEQCRPISIEMRVLGPYWGAVK